MNNLLQISDCHISKSGRSLGVNSAENLANVISKITTLKPDAIVISGDLSQNGCSESYQILKQILQPLKTKIFVLAGNHDNLANLKLEFGENLFQSFKLNTWEIININSVQAGKTSGRVSQSDLEELQKALKNSNSKYILLTLHHPIVPLKSTWDDDLSLENPQELFEILDKYPKIQAVIFGHAHQAGEFRRKNLRIFSCPSTAKQFDAEDKIGFNHYQLGDNGKIKMQTKWLKMAKN